jgi:hypothetical protein
MKRRLTIARGLVNDPRNRSSVDRYIRLAAEPFATDVQGETADISLEGVSEDDTE